MNLADRCSKYFGLIASVIFFMQNVLFKVPVYPSLWQTYENKQQWNIDLVGT